MLGSAFSLADIYLFVVASWLESDGVAIDEFPGVADHYQAHAGPRPPVQEALAV